MANSKRTFSFIGGFTTLFVLAIVFFTCFSIDRIDSGQTGVMVNLAGNERVLMMQKWKQVG